VGLTNKNRNNILTEEDKKIKIELLSFPSEPELDCKLDKTLYDKLKSGGLLMEYTRRGQ
jgi:hypothetical protein